MITGVSGRTRRSDGSYGPGVVWFDEGRVTGLTEGCPAPAEALERQILDVGSAYVLPGAIDAHVHSYSNPYEGLEAATRSAAAGGVTTIVEMPFDVSGPINSLERLESKKELTRRAAVVDVALLGTLAPGGGWRLAGDLADAGVVGFKLSLFDTDAFRFPRIDDSELRDAFGAIAQTGLTVCVHAENNEIVKKLSSEMAAADPFDPLTHVRTRPPVTETLGVLTAAEIAREAGVRLHLCHMSTPRAIDIASWFRASGTDITAETCPHYLVFTIEDMQRQGGRLKINPPIRTREELEGLWQRLESGDIQLLTSDHAPWPLSRKTDREILKNASGVPGVETLPTVCLSEALKRDPSPQGLFDTVVRALTCIPADRYGFGDRKGRLAPGYDADIMVFDPDVEYTISDEDMHSHAGWTPYAGITIPGRVILTLSRGEVVWDASSGKVGEPGRGRIVSCAT